MTNYFIKHDGKESGPFTFEQLKSISIDEDTPVWHAGMKEWTTASDSLDLKRLFRKKKSLRFFAKIKFRRRSGRKTSKNQT